jgi:hypothetical protein
MQTDGYRPDALRTPATSHCAPHLSNTKRASLVLDLEEKVAAVVKKLKERGLVSP